MKSFRGDFLQKNAKKNFTVCGRRLGLRALSAEAFEKVSSKL